MMRHYQCPLCGDRFGLAVDRRVEFPEEWYWYVVHNHDGDEPCWESALHYHPKRYRYHPEAKRIDELQREQRRQMKIREQRSKAGRKPERLN